MPRRMPLIYSDHQHWQARAIEARTMADQMLCPEGRQRMLAIAGQYDKIAERAVERLRAAAEGRLPLVSEDTEDMD